MNRLVNWLRSLGRSPDAGNGSSSETLVVPPEGLTEKQWEARRPAHYPAERDDPKRERSHPKKMPPEVT